MSANVPRMRLRSSLSEVQHSTCDPEVNAQCATNEVVQFFVCCATFVLSVGLLFFNAELVFLKPCLFQRLVRNLIFLIITLKVQNFETTSSDVRVGIRTGVGTRCAGAWVCW